MSDDDKTKSKSSVTLRNTLRRPVSFRVAGTTVRLSPRQGMQVPEEWLASTELRRFCSSGMVTAQSAPAKDEEEHKKEKKTPKEPKPPRAGKTRPDDDGD